MERKVAESLVSKPSFSSIFGLPMDCHVRPTIMYYSLRIFFRFHLHNGLCTKIPLSIENSSNRNRQQPINPAPQTLKRSTYIIFVMFGTMLHEILRYV